MHFDHEWNIPQDDCDASFDMHRESCGVSHAPPPIRQEFDCGGDRQVIRHQHLVRHNRDIVNEYDVVHEYNINHYDVVKERNVVRHNNFSSHQPNYCGCDCGCSGNCSCNIAPVRPRPLRQVRRRFW
ncbi:MAG: hypothetical protein FWC91_10090 [Defluviitaleaceae bacterium]|nr:hypothetical protein [Defluviitaleaceae bacterium]